MKRTQDSARHTVALKLIQVDNRIEWRGRKNPVDTLHTQVEEAGDVLHASACTIRLSIRGEPGDVRRGDRHLTH